MRILIAGLICILATLCCAQTPIGSIDIKNDMAIVTMHPPARGRTVQPVIGAPYSADRITEQSQTLTDGTHITQGKRTVHLYCDSQGRTRTERPLAMPQQTEDWAPITEIRDPMAVSTYILDHQNKIAHQFALAVVPRQASPCLNSIPGDASRPQCSSEKLATQNMEGLIVEGTRETRIWPIGSQGNDRSMTDTIETWISTELHDMVLSKFANPRDGETLIRLTNVSRAEPDQSLFQPPADYNRRRERLVYDHA